jgi:hypothetical protein
MAPHRTREGNSQESKHEAKMKSKTKLRIDRRQQRESVACLHTSPSPDRVKVKLKGSRGNPLRRVG